MTSSRLVGAVATILGLAPARNPDNGCSAKGDSYSIDYVFKKDGAYDYGWRATIGGESGKRPPGTLRVNGGKMQWKSSQGFLWTTTLYEDKKGKRKLKGRREDGNRWQLKEKK